MVDLEKLKLEIESIGGSIRELKEKGGGKDEIGALVTKLNTLKQEYADNNNGIGFDGKPHQKPLSKAEKKKLEKEKKAAAAAAAAKNDQVRHHEDAMLSLRHPRTEMGAAHH